METAETNDTKGWIIGAIVLVIVVGGGWWMLKNSKASSSVVGDKMGTSTEEVVLGDDTEMKDTDTAVTVSTTAPAKTSVTTAADGEKVSVKDQAAGSAVAIDSMNLVKTGWVAIKDVKGILGAAWYPAGTTVGTVPLLRPTVAGGAYQAVIYVDDGDKKFDMYKDTLVMGTDGSPVAASFLAK